MATETVTVSTLRTDNAAWLLAAGASKAAAVQTPDDDATSYISAPVGTATSATINFNIASPTVVQSGDTISSIQVSFRRRRDIAGGNNENVTYRVMVNGTLDGSSRSTTNITSTTWTSINATALTVNPISGVAWTYTDLTQLAIRIQCSAVPTTASLDVTSISVTITYTAASANVTATPGVASLATATFAPTVTATNNKTATPGVLALTTATFAPVVTSSDNKSAVPGVVSLTTAAFAPTVAISDNKTATPTVASLGTTTFAPSVSVSDNKTAVPGVASLATSGFAPSVSISDNQTATPGTLAITTTAFAPSVSVSDNQSATPGTANLTLAGFAPAVTASDHQTVTPDPAALVVTTYAPDVTATVDEEDSGPQTVTPGFAELVTTAYAPTVTVTEVPVEPPAPVFSGGGGGYSAVPWQRQWKLPVPPEPKPQRVAPIAARLTLTTFAPTVLVRPAPRKPAKRPRTVTPPPWATEEAELDELLLLGVL